MLAQSRNVAANVIEVFRAGDDVVMVYVTVKGFADDPPFYRPVVDDPPERRRAAYAEVIGRLESDPPPDFEVIDGYPETGLALIHANLATVSWLARQPHTFAVAAPDPVEPLLSNSMGIVSIPPVHQQGLKGTGSKIAVIDGSFWADKLTNTIVERHCFCRKFNGTGCCANGSDEQHSGTQAATLPTAPHEEHATTVSSVIATNTSTGAAPQSQIVAIATGHESGTDDIRALQWLLTRPDIKIVNMSFGTGDYASTCNNEPSQAARLAILTELRSYGVTLIAAAGNDTQSNKMRSPACLSPTISVAGTWTCNWDNNNCANPDAVIDKLWFKTNASSATDLAAPAEPIWLTSPNFGDQRLYWGTSYAAPFVSSCAALLHQDKPGADPERIRGALRSSTKQVTRPGYGSYARLNCQQALSHLRNNTGIRLNQHGLTGGWYNPWTSGQGLQIEVYPDAIAPGKGILFSGWFTYAMAPAGGYEKQRWFALQGEVDNTKETANLVIFTNYGGNFDAPPITNGVQVGTATIRFDTCTRGALSYSFNANINGGRKGVIPLTRLLGNAGCSEIGAGSTSKRFKLSGNWYEPATSGQGLVIEINPVSQRLFAGWFTFAPNGQSIGGAASQRWYTLQAPIPATGNSFANIPIVGTTGGVFDDPKMVSTVQVGTATLSFQSCSAATLSYSFNAGPNAGKNGVINLSRSGPVPAGCAL